MQFHISDISNYKATKRKPEASFESTTAKNLSHLMPSPVFFLVSISTTAILLLLLLFELPLTSARINFPRENDMDDNFLPVPQPRGPRFGETDTETNVQRISVGRPVKFKCVVHDIGNHTVSISNQLDSTCYISPSRANLSPLRWPPRSPGFTRIRGFCWQRTIK